MSSCDGILIAVKDNIHVAGFPNSAGTPTLAHFKPQTSAPVIQKLIDQGAIIVGKANMHELAFGVTGYNIAQHIEGVVGTRNAVTRYTLLVGLLRVVRWLLQWAWFRLLWVQTQVLLFDCQVP